ncbi:methyltransferase domain-containing protein [Gordonia sp. zg691]|uniref:Methyltransferase domain-containing protein n=1 Tax=Gordonia jinghuaiqii TaxID=2758710 RepID=A0A7D7LRX2_9ACTN|nr:class I SAM-dependent methyltransferase [Gordonia jinghuaiqii]MBD0863113.1 methyltransferase domain-containing protein [Gordonia jinghuaiqii]MCR5980376.1 methyltransferase domain-containing protein [Gordonia jinghuaiqii]QMT01885.1 methyltransferase domain-containing protein [Gordonia jinghuaiqii]
MTTTQPTPIDAEIKARHRKLWASGDYPAVAGLIAPLGRRLVDALHIEPKQKVVDVAAGAGNVAVPAAQAGGHVVATDLTPELLETGESRHRDLGITWRTADAEDLPFDDDDFDVATSCVGVMFAPNHQKCADELVRVVRPDGQIGLINWTPTGFIGELLGVLKPYAPPPPPGARPGPLWGDADHVRSLFGERVSDHQFTTATVEIDDFTDGAAFRDFFKAHYGPTIMTYRNIGDDAARVAELDAAIAAHADRYITNGRMEWEYLQAVMTVA